ncbi:unnamed protein product [Coregonus sp. 'balchen']|nr:unnamed protein product [Coregonus sp. 'balchen']
MGRRHVKELHLGLEEESWFFLGFRFGDGYSLPAFTGFVSVKKLQDLIQAGSEAKLCASLLQPNETLVMTISLMADGQNNILLHKSSDQEFHRCFQFQAPHVKSDKVQNFKVEVRGDTFLSTEERKVMIKPYSPMTFIQTDKPIYNPGQTVVTLDTNFSPVNQLYNIVELEDVNQNRIGQWLNTTSSGNILQLSHPLNSEAPVGSYAIVVWIGQDKIYQNFKVEKYVLPKFEIKMNLTNEISIVQEEYEVEVCAKYTYGQPVPGKAGLKLCRLLGDNVVIPITIDEKHPQGVPDYTPPCHKESIEMDLTGCASCVFNMAIFTKNLGEKLLGDVFSFHAEVQEEGTGITRSEEKRIALSYVIGELSFVDTPQIYEHGSIIEGKIYAVHFNNTPISDMLVYLLEEKGWSSYLQLQNLTTDSRGIARFSLNTTSMPKENINLIPAAPDRKPSSSLAIQKMEKPLACGEEVSITIHYAIVGETVPKGSVDVLYLHGHKNVTVQQDSPVAEGEVTLKLAVVPEMAPVVQLLVYSMLPSETVIAHSMNFPTEKCFRNKVLVEFSPSNAVPGEENTLHLSAQPGSLCGLSAVDQSVGIMEPGKRLDADKVNTSALFSTLKPLYCSGKNQSPYRHDVFNLQVTLLKSPEAKTHALGLKLATNLDIRIPSCLSYQGNQYYRSYAGPRLEMAIAGGVAPTPPPPIQTVRTFFPETWIWDLVGNYTLTPLNDVHYSSCLCANGRKTFSWTMAPSVLGVLNVSVSAAAVHSHTACDHEIVNVPERGRVDTVTRSLLVTAEGTEKTDTYNWLLCPTGETLTEEVELQLPQNVVDGSDRISLTGGVTDEVTLTAYVTASMLELDMSVSDPVVDRSLSCLKNSTSDLSNTYTTALLAYTFALAGDMETRAQLLQHLNTISLQEGGLLHWSQSSSETSPSLEVETSAYVLLASLSASPLSTSDLGYASRIVRWLVRQQNAYGGFSSTQDTVVALQALALYSTRVFSRGGASTVTVQSPSGHQYLFYVNQNNKLLYQERALQDTEGKYSIEVKGSACASVQVALHYNIPTPTKSTTLSIQVTPEVDCNSKSLRPRVTLKLQCQYHGKELTTNMIIVDLKMLSGFSPDPDSLGRLRGSSQVDRVDTKDDHVLTYLTELTSLFPFTITLDIIQELPVQNLKPAVVKIYDYYQPSDQAETEYVFPCK